MIDVSLFGALLGTLGSALSVFLLIAALAALSVLAATGVEAARRLGPGGAAAGDRAIRAVGISAGLGGLLFALLGLRVGSGAGELVPTVAVSVAWAAALGASAACAWALSGRGLAALGAAQARRQEGARLAESTRARALEAAQRAHRGGDDLRAEVARSEAAIERLRAAVEGLSATHAALEEKVAAAASDPPLAADAIRARDEVALRIDLGRRVLDAAEGAAFRLACNAPLRALLRRRPREATQALAGGAASDAAIHAAIAAIEAFLAAVRAGHAELDEVASRRPASQPPGDDDALVRARRELDAMEAAYSALLERLGLAQLRLSARAGAAVVETAAGALPGAAAAAALDPGEIQALVTEVARADAAVAIAAPEAAGPRAIAEALAAGSAALDRSDAASLWDLITALREVR